MAMLMGSQEQQWLGEEGRLLKGDDFIFFQSNGHPLEIFFPLRLVDLVEESLSSSK